MTRAPELVDFDPSADGAAGGRVVQLRQHRNALRACAQRLLHDDAQADAIVDEVLANAAQVMTLFRPAGSLGGWLQGLTIGVSLARLQQDDRAASARGRTHAAPRSRDRSAAERIPIQAND
jgi:DNA-directed RNA polymerase specialized sigma24 family protein